MNRDNRLDRAEILVYLNRIEDATDTAPTGKLALFADMLLRDQITGGEMADALRGCLVLWKGTKFPPYAKVRAWARPDAVNQPRRDETPAHDAIRSLEDERSVLWAWARHFESGDNLFRRDEVECDIRRLEAQIDRRLMARGMPPRYGEKGVATFDGIL